MLMERSHIKRKMNFRERIDSVKAAFTGLPGTSLLSMAQKFSPLYGEPPRRSTEDWIDLFNKSPRMNPIHQIASDVGTSAYGVFTKNDSKKIKLIDSQLEKLFKTPSPNETMTEYVLFYITQVYLLLPSGEAFWIKERSGLGKVTELWPVPPNWVLEIPSVTKAYFTIYPQGNIQASPIHVPPRDMVYFKKPNIVNPYLRGIGRAEGIGDEIETDEYMAKYQKRYFFNDAIPPMVGMMPGADEATVNRTGEVWQQKYGGYNNKHKMAWLNFDAKFQILKETAKDMDFIESRKYLRDVSNQHFNIPPELFGILENSNRSTIDAAYYLYTKNVLRKELKFIDDTLNRQLVPEFSQTIYVEHDNVVPEDDEFKLKKASEGLKNGGIIVDEWRRANGWDELPNGAGKILYTPLNMIPTKLDGTSLVPNIAPEPEPPKQVKKKITIEMKEGMWQVFDKAAIKNERAFINVLKKYFQRQQDEINQSLEKGVKKITDNPDDLLNWKEENNKLIAQLNPQWQRSFQEGVETANELFGFGLSFEVFNPKFLNWVEEFGAEQVKGINDVTKDKLRRTLSEGVEGGESIPKLRDRVSQVMGEAKTSRAVKIARTETHNTVGAGTFETYGAAQVRQKEWLTSLDGRERDSHAAINGQVVGMNQAFSNGLMYPGDPSGNASEVVNCRCTLLPVLDGKEVPNPEQWARDQGLAENINYQGMDADIATKVNNELFELNSKYPAMKGKIKNIETFSGTEWDGAAVYSADTNTLKFNNFIFGNKNADELLRSYQTGFTFDPSILGTVKHEFGHAAWTNLLTEAEQSKIRRELTSLVSKNKRQIEQLSKYAHSHSQGMEAVAELFNAKVNGTKFEAGQVTKIDKALKPLWDKLGLE